MDTFIPFYFKTAVVFVYIYLAVGILVGVTLILGLIWGIHWLVTRSRRGPGQRLPYASPRSVESTRALTKPQDLNNETGYCERCRQFSPSRDGQCLTCGSVVHVR